MRFRRYSTHLLAIALLLPSCATIVSSTRYTVPIRTEPSGATYRITDRKGKVVKEGITPALVELKAANGYFKRGIYRVDLVLEGRKPASAVLHARVNGWYWGNVLFGGAAFIGMLIVDPATGAMYRLDKAMVYEGLEWDE
ncbi:MAG: hypothetical protein ACK46G_10705 [Flavobacteriales bacterium]|jgi:hypothetical protein